MLSLCGCIILKKAITEHVRNNHKDIASPIIFALGSFNHVHYFTTQRLKDRTVILYKKC